MATDTPDPDDVVPPCVDGDPIHDPAATAPLAGRRDDAELAALTGGLFDDSKVTLTPPPDAVERTWDPVSGRWVLPRGLEQTNTYDFADVEPVLAPPERFDFPASVTEVDEPPSASTGGRLAAFATLAGIGLVLVLGWVTVGC